ncbi:hypothetical protein D3C80_1478890 [compost metagenome]
MALAEPIQVPPHLVGGIKALLFQQAFRQTECHGRVIRPLSRLQPEYPASDHILHKRKGAGSLELHRGSERIPSGQPVQASPIAVFT